MTPNYDEKSAVFDYFIKESLNIKTH